MTGEPTATAPPKVVLLVIDGLGWEQLRLGDAVLITL